MLIKLMPGCKLVLYLQYSHSSPTRRGEMALRYTPTGTFQFHSNTKRIYEGLQTNATEAMVHRGMIVSSDPTCGPQLRSLASRPTQGYYRSPMFDLFTSLLVNLLEHYKLRYAHESIHS